MHTMDAIETVESVREERKALGLGGSWSPFYI